jgi:hypothetical protein
MGLISSTPSLVLASAILAVRSDILQIKVPDVLRLNLARAVLRPTI